LTDSLDQDTFAHAKKSTPAFFACLTASEKAVKLVQLGRGSGRQRPNKRGLPHLIWQRTE